MLPGLVAAQDTMRIATWAAPLGRDGPGLLLQDILAGDDPQITATLTLLVQARPDILLLTDFDHDPAGAALGAFQAALADRGVNLPHVFAAQPNSGRDTGLDVDGNGNLGDARDALGYGRFSGAGGLAILSRWPIDSGRVTDLSTFLWRDLPGAALPMAGDQPFFSAEVLAMLPVSSTAHWVVPVDVPDGPLTLMAFSATPPVFDGAEDMNGLRAVAELRLWQALMDGELPVPPPAEPFVILGNANLDPADGEGDRQAMTAFLADPRWQDPRPASPGAQAAADPGQSGDPALDTVDWRDGVPGNLRVSYVLPSADLAVLDAGVLWPAPDTASGPDGDPAALVDLAGAHRLVWVDVRR
jgi:hypothetical protein